MLLKHQRFKDSGSDKTESRGLKCARFNARDDKEEEYLDEYECEGKRENIRYILFLFITPLLPPQKESNYPINKGKKIRNLNHLIYIPNIG